MHLLGIKAVTLKSQAKTSSKLSVCYSVVTVSTEIFGSVNRPLDYGSRNRRFVLILVRLSKRKTCKKYAVAPFRNITYDSFGIH